ncbi:MAG: hypothetical protein ACWA41_06995 [Putridiphycobacter sp.]
MKLDKYEFYCPDCHQRLDENNEIHLKINNPNDGRVDIFLSTSLGNYEKRTQPEISFNNGDYLDFHCPHCESKIHAKDRDKFVHLIMKVENKFDFDILFSRVAGEQKTFLVTEDGVECYGNDCEEMGDH